MNDKDCAKCGAELVWVGSVMGGKMCCPRCTVPEPASCNDCLAIRKMDPRAGVTVDTLSDAIVHGKSFQTLVYDPAAVGEVSIERIDPRQVYLQHWEAVAQREYAEKVKTRCQSYFEPQEKVKAQRQGKTAAQAMEEMRGRDPRYLINEAQMLLRDLFLMEPPTGTAYRHTADRLVKALDQLARELHRS